MMRQVLLLVVWVDHVTIEVGLSDPDDMVRVVYVDMMMQWVVVVAAGDRGTGNGDRMGGVVWSGEHSLVDIIRVLGS
jgi:hypothetical protein